MISPSRGGYWSSPFHLVCAAVMAILGAGVILRLPALALSYGGGAFLVVYLLSLLCVAWPLLTTEWLFGRLLRQDLLGNLQRDISARGASRMWNVIGVLYLMVPLVLVSYYVVMAGWSLGFVPRALSGVLLEATREGAAEPFLGLAQDAERSLAWHTIFVVLVGTLAARGLNGGIEWASSWLLLVALALIFFLALYAGRQGAIGHGLALWGHFDWGALGWRGVFEALRQALFTAGLGLGIMVAYGSFLSERASLMRLSAIVLASVTGLAFLAGTVIYGLLLHADLAVGGQLSVLFESMVIYAIINEARWVPAAVYGLVVVLAMVSALALMEPLVQYTMARKRCTRVMAAATVGALVWLLGIGTVLTFGSSNGAELFGRDIFAWLQMFSAQLGTPLVLLLMVIYVGRVWQRSELDSALHGSNLSQHAPGRQTLALRFALVYPVRIATIAVLLYSLGAIQLVFGFWGLV